MMTRRDDFALDESVLTMTRLDLLRRFDRGIRLVVDQELGLAQTCCTCRLKIIG